MQIRGMDDIFHLWANITIESPSGKDSIEFQIEKNSIVEMTKIKLKRKILEN
jgi:hypothetical protein